MPSTKGIVRPYNPILQPTMSVLRRPVQDTGKLIVETRKEGLRISLPIFQRVDIDRDESVSLGLPLQMVEIVGRCNQPKRFVLVPILLSFTFTSRRTKHVYACKLSVLIIQFVECLRVGLPYL